MKKIPGFYVLCALLFISASFIAPTSWAADEPKFCFESTMSALYLSQKTSADAIASGQTCFDAWYDDNCTHGSGSCDAYDYINDWLTNNQGSPVYITSNIDFAGSYETSPGSGSYECSSGNLAFKGKGIDLREGSRVKSDDKGPHTISGLCYIGSSDISFIGQTQGSSVSDLIFDDVFFSSTLANASVGLFDIASTYSVDNNVENITVKNSRFYSMGSAGAIYGSITAATAKTSFQFVKLDNVIVSGDIYAGGFIGNIEDPDALDFSNNAVKDVEIRGSHTGGLVGNIVNTYTGLFYTKNLGLSIKNNYIIGSITNNSGQDSESGYLIGKLADASNPVYVITNNYFYSNDAIPSSGIGTLGKLGWRDPSLSGSSVIQYNFRNAVTGLDVDGTLYDDPDEGVVHDGSSTYYNGVIDESYMMTKTFAAILNRGGSVWSYDKNVNKNLPFFANGSYKPIYKITLDIADFRNNASTTKTKLLQDSLTKGTRFTVSYIANSKNREDLYFYTNNTGHLEDVDVTFATKLLDSDKYWSSGVEQALNKGTIFQDNDIYSYETNKSGIQVTYYICQSWTNPTTCYEKKLLSSVLSEDIAFLDKYVSEYSSNSYNLKIPRFLAKDVSSDPVTIITPTHYRVGTTGSIEEIGTKQYFRDLSKSDDEIEIIYDYSGASSFSSYRFYVDYGSSAEPYSIKSYIYNASGKKDSSTTTITSPGTGSTFPLATGFKVATEAGYSVDYTLEFKSQMLTLPSADTVRTTAHHIVTSDEYKKKIQTHVWKLKDLTEKDSLVMDTVYNAITNGIIGSFNIKITPTISLITYNVTFDTLKPTMFVPDEYLGNNWIFSKNYSVESSDKTMPELYAVDKCVLWTPDTTMRVPDLYAAFGENLASKINAKDTLYPMLDDCYKTTPPKSTVTLHTNGNGKVEFWQIIGNPSIKTDTIRHTFTYDDAASSLGDTVYTLEVPKVTTNAVQFTFEIHAIPNDDTKHYVASSGIYTLESGIKTEYTDGEEIAVTDDIELHANFTSVGPSFYVAFDLSYDPTTEDVYIPSGAKSTAAYSYNDIVNGSAELFRPARPVDDEYCFAGWSFEKNPSSANWFTTIYENDLYRISDDQLNPTMLYAVWQECAYLKQTKTAAYTLKNGDANTTLVLYQTFGSDVLRHTIPETGVDLENAWFDYDGVSFDGYDFYFDETNSTPLGAGKEMQLTYVDSNHPDEDPIEVAKSNGVWNVSYKNVGGIPIYIFNAVATNLEKKFVFNLDTTKTTYYGPDWVKSISIPKGVTDVDFPRDVRRKDSCFVGWSLFKNGINGTFGYNDMTFQDDLKQVTPDITTIVNDQGEIVEVWTYDLYSSWEGGDACYQEMVAISTVVPEYEGEFTVLQITDGDTTFAGVVGDTGLTVPKIEGMSLEILYAPKANYPLQDSIVVVRSVYMMQNPLMNSDTSNVVNGGSVIISHNDYAITLDVPGKTDYEFVLDVNADDVFYDMSFYEFTVKAEANRHLPFGVHRTGYKLAGWSFEKDGSPMGMFNQPFEEAYVKYTLKNGTPPDTLYAIWDKVENAEVYTIVNMNPRVGPFILMQDVAGHFTEHILTDTLKIPAGEEYEFMVELDADLDRWNIDFRNAILVADSDGVVYDTLENSYMIFVRESMGLKPNTDIELPPDTSSVSPDTSSVSPDTSTVYPVDPTKLDSATQIVLTQKDFMQSGSAVCIRYKTNELEQEHHVLAWLEVINTATGDVVADPLLYDSLATGLDDEVVVRIKNPGEYIFYLTVENGHGIDDYSGNFTVSSEIASIEEDGWQMVSLAAVDTSLLPKKKNADQVFYWWDESGTGEFWQYKSYVRGDSVVDTRGVWYSSLKGAPLVLRSDINDEAKDFVLNLDSVSSGWNMIANPYNWTVDLFAMNSDKKKPVDEKADVTFYSYNAETGGYVETDVMKPNEAVWAKVSGKKKWKVSAKPVFVSEERESALLKRVLAKASTKERWTLQAVLSDGNGKQDSWNILGAGLNPFTAAEPPESMGDHVNLSIVEGKRALAKSIRYSSDDMEWNVALSASSDRMGYLTLSGIDGVNAFGYHVYVTVDGNTTEMKEGEPLKVFLKESVKMATIRVAPAEKIVVENSLKGLRMARLGGKLQVTFDATGLAGKSARVDLVDMKGHVISTMSAKTVEGSNALLLDAPQTGLYMLRVRAGSKRQATKVVVK